MDFVFNEEQQELRATARAFLSENSASAQIRNAMESDLGFDAQLWKQLASLGWRLVLVMVSTPVLECISGFGRERDDHSTWLSIAVHTHLKAVKAAKGIIGTVIINWTVRTLWRYWLRPYHEKARWQPIVIPGEQ